MKNEQSSGSAPRCYLVTGVAGFIASKVAEQLLEAGHTVVGVDNLNDYYDVRLKLYRLRRLTDLAGLTAHSSKLSAISNQVSASNPRIGADSLKLTAVSSARFTFEPIDIEDLPALESVFERSDFAAVFNLAARAGVRYSLEFPELYRRTNVLGEENVLKCQVKHGVRKHILASSSSVYAGCPMPFIEDAELGPMQSPYAETKRQAELLAHDYHRKHGLDVTVLRYFTVFGPAGRPDMAPFRFIKWIDEGTPITLYGDGNQARDFTYVDDIARGTILAGQLFGGKLPVPKAESGKLKAEGSDPKASLSSTQVSGFRSQVSASPSAFSFQPSGFPAGIRPSYEVVNLGGGNNPVSLRAIIGWIETALSDKRSALSGGPVSRRAVIDQRPPSAADMKETWADIGKAKRLLNWQPEVSPQEGFKRSVVWHVANRDWLKEIKL